MVGKLQNSASVEFRESDDAKRLVMETDSDPVLVAQKGTSYVKIYPSSASPSVTALIGGVSLIAKDIPDDITDYVSFSGASSSSLRYFPTGTVEIISQHFFNSAPAVAYNADTNSIVLDTLEAHGIVKVHYRAYFNRYIVTHGDDPCDAANTQSQSNETGSTSKSQANYDPAFLVATAEGWATASMEVSGPPCSQGERGYIDSAPYNKYEPVGIKIETDAQVPPALYPSYFSADNIPMGFSLTPQIITISGKRILLYAGCRVRVYPKIAVTLYGVNCAVGSTVVGSGTKPILQSLTFSGSQSVNLDYPPSGSVSLTSMSANAISLFNETVSVRFAGPGEWVNEVVWKTRNTYELSQSARRVREDEVVALSTPGSNTIPCYTFAQAQYTSEYYLYDVLFNWDDRINWYGPAMVLAVASDGRMGTLQIEPPAKKGIL